MVIDKAGCGFKGYASISKDYKEAGNVMANLGIIACFDNLKKEAPVSFLFSIIMVFPHLFRMTVFMRRP